MLADSSGMGNYILTEVIIYTERDRVCSYLILGGDIRIIPRTKREIFTPTPNFSAFEGLIVLASSGGARHVPRPVPETYSVWNLTFVQY